MKKPTKKKYQYFAKNSINAYSQSKVDKEIDATTASTSATAKVAIFNFLFTITPPFVLKFHEWLRSSTQD